MDMVKNLKYIFFAVILLVLGGCGVKTIYNQMDWILAGVVEDYIHLTEVQDEDVERRIADILKWHRKTQLPLYSSDLRQVKQYTKEGLSDKKIEHFFGLLNQRWIAIKGKISPEIAGLLMTLSDKQVLKMFKNIKEQNEEYIEEHVDITQKERDKAIIERMIDNFERWLGDLSNEQKALFWQWKDRFKPVHNDRLEFRRVWQKELRLILNSNISKKEKEVQLVELFRNPDKFRSQVYIDKLAHNRNQAAQLILTMSLTPEQKKHLYKEVDYYTKNFDELAAEEIK